MDKTMKPKLLFIDDRTKRMHHALTVSSELYDVTIASNFHEAMRQLCQQDFDVVSLDHDLNGCDFEDPDSPACGMEIVRYIVKCGWPPQRKVPDFWIHSSNLFAAHLMVVTLTEAGFNAWYKPIVYKVENMQYDSKGLPL